MSKNIKGGKIIKKMNLKQYRIFVGIVVIVLVVAILFFGWPREEVPGIVGVYDLVNSENWIEFKTDGTTQSIRFEEDWYGVWTQLDDGNVNVAITGGPQKLIYEITETGLICLTWENAVYIKRGV